MSDKLYDFFTKVRAVAKECGVEAYVTCAVVPDGGASNIRVASSVLYQFKDKTENFHERCADAMEESVDVALAHLVEANEPDFVN